jgi:phospholipid N-methyltransferase
MAEDVESKAEESLSKNRLANTHRRIRIAEQAEKQAERDKAFAITLRNIASAITDGMATHLENLTQKVQLEELERILNRAAWSEFHSKSQEYSGNRPEQPTRECVAFAKLPELSIEKSNAERVLAYHGNKDGFKLLAVQLRNRVKSANGESVLLDEAFARKLVEKVGKDLDWLSSDLNTLDRLSRMGIVTDEQLRAALRELIGIRETAKEPDKLKQMKRDLVGTKIPGFFPTPRKVVELMLQEAEIKPGMTVLEPSAGSGNIAAVVKELHPEAEIQVIEINFTLREILHQQGFNIVGNNFLDHNDSYDRIIMNPPFEIHQDIDHVHHAFNLLKPGGKLISIMCEGTFFRSDPKSRFFREWLNDDVNASMVKLEDGAFLSSDRPTGVATRMVVIDKAMQS